MSVVSSFLSTVRHCFGSSTCSRRRGAKIRSWNQSAQVSESLESRIVLTPQFNFTFPVGTPQFVQDAAVHAGDTWSANFHDDVIINLTIDYQDLGSGGLGGAAATIQSNTFLQVMNAMSSDITTADDSTATTAVNGLTVVPPGPGPQLPAYNAIINRTADHPNQQHIPDPADRAATYSALYNTVQLTTANAKALGLLSGTAPGSDGTITVGSGVTWDTDPYNGTTTGQFDLVGNIVHEIGHVIGFWSSATDLDFGPGQDASDYTPFVLDLFRDSNEGSVDISADARDKDFSIDGGTTLLTGFSTGSFGNGHQSDHWEDFGTGIVDPFDLPGGLQGVTELDVRAFDVIGWDRRFAAAQNPSIRHDVNNDGIVTANDALRVINAVNDRISGDLYIHSHETQNFLDVTGDGHVTALDALNVINFLNNPSGEGEAPPSTQLGVLDFESLLNESVAGTKYYEFEAANTGTLTVESFASIASGNVDLTLYKGTNSTPVATSSSFATSNERVDVAAVAGDTFILKVSGTNSDVDLVITDLLNVSGSTATVTGTSDSDVLTVSTNGSNYTVVINGTDYTVTGSTIAAIAFNAGAGSDTATLTTGSGYDAAYLYSTSYTVNGSGYQLTGSGVESKQVISTGGSDRGYLYDSSANDTFVSRNTYSYMSGGGFYSRVDGFYYAYGYANNGGYDRTYFYDSSGNDTYYGFSSGSYLLGSGYYNYAGGFDAVYAYSFYGGNDTAYFYDSPGNDTFYARSTYSYMSGSGFFNYQYGFDNVSLYGYYGGNNVLDLDTTNYLFSWYGTWSVI